MVTSAMCSITFPMARDIAATFLCTDRVLCQYLNQFHTISVLVSSHYVAVSGNLGIFETCTDDDGIIPSVVLLAVCRAMELLYGARNQELFWVPGLHW